MKIQYLTNTSGDCIQQIDIECLEKKDIDEEGKLILKIPASLNGKRITAVGFDEHSSNLKGEIKHFLLAPPSLKSEINKVSLIEYDIEEGIETLNRLKTTKPVKLKVPLSVTRINKTAFKDMILDISFDSLCKIKEIEDHVFDSASFTSDFYLPKKCKSIGSYAFYKASFSNGFHFNQELKIIKNNAFNSVSFETSVILSFPDSLEQIEDCAFFNANDILMIIFGKKSNITRIDYAAFSLSEIKKAEISSINKNIEFGICCFYNCPNLLEVDLSNTFLTKIPTSCFMLCASLEAIRLPITITEINDKAFKSTHLEKFVFPPNLKSIGIRAFADCKNLEKIDLSKAPLSKIEPQTFANATKLKEVKLPLYFSDLKYNVFEGLAPEKVKEFVKDLPFVELG